MFFVEKTKDLIFFKRFDYYLFVPAIFLNIIGILVVHSAVMSKGEIGLRIVITQIIGLSLGLVCAFIICKLDYKDLKTLSFIFYGFSLLLILYVLIFGTGDQLGSRRWMNIGPLSFQPSEITKITFIIIVSLYLEKLLENRKNFTKNLIQLIFFASIPILLIIIQKDFGTSLIFIAILSTMLFVFGLSYRYFAILSGTFIISLPFVWFFLLNESRKNRIRVFLDPTMDPLGAGLNVLRSKMTIGSGQVIGKGLFQGPQTQTSFVPVKESDFIFSVIGEELGFIGALFVIFLIVFILIRLIHVSMRARDAFGTFLIIGVCAMIGTQSIENIGMSIGLLPVTGLTLPFVSAGGSSLISSWIALGITLSVSMRRRKSLFQ